MDWNLCWLMFAAGVLIDTRDTHCAQHCSTNDFATDCKQTQTGFKRLENATTVCLVLNLLLMLGWTRSNPSITFSFSFSRYWICLESKLPLGRYLSGLSILSSTLLQSLHLTNSKYCEYSLLIFFRLSLTCLSWFFSFNDEHFSPIFLEDMTVVQVKIFPLIDQEYSTYYGTAL